MPIEIYSSISTLGILDGGLVGRSITIGNLALQYRVIGFGTWICHFYAANFLLFFSFLPLKTLKLHILKSVWSAQHPNAGWNIQQSRFKKQNDEIIQKLKRKNSTKIENIWERKRKSRTIKIQVLLWDPLRVVVRDLETQIFWSIFLFEKASSMTLLF